MDEQQICRKPISILLVIFFVVVILILILIIFPLLPRRDGLAPSTACLSNMKQLGGAFMQYCNDWNDRFPFDGQAGSHPTYAGWVCAESSQMCWRDTYGPNNKRPKNFNFDEKIANPSKGSIYPYTKNLGLYKCPQYNKWVKNKRIGQGEVDWNAGLAMCTYAYNHHFTPLVKGNRIPLTLNKITFLADTYLLYDESPEYIDDADFIPGYDLPSDLHSSGTNVVLADGHAKRFNKDKLTPGGTNFCYGKPQRIKLTTPGATTISPKGTKPLPATDCK
jgi:prepilin-type processing-associated H-X9-DG protein